MAEDRWRSIALPILEFIHEHANSHGFGVLNVGTIAEGTGIDPWEVAHELDRLHEAGYLSARLQMLASGGDPRPWFISGAGLGERGLRTVGAWPTDDPYEALVELLERRIGETTDQETKTKLMNLKGAMATVGKSTVAGLLVALATGGIHF